MFPRQAAPYLPLSELFSGTSKVTCYIKRFYDNLKTYLKTTSYDHLSDALRPQGQYWIEYLSITNNSNYQYGRC